MDSERLTQTQALELIEGEPDTLRRRAHQARCQRYPEGRASYVVMRIVSYTNVCVADCSYCAFTAVPAMPRPMSFPTTRSPRRSTI
jgi:cyclic dehypoxanthinyl futalosine synthase